MRRSGDLKQRKQNQQADGQMHRERMKAAEKLLPVGVRLAIEAKNHGSSNKRDS